MCKRQVLLVNIKYYMDSFLGAEISEFYSSEANSARLPPLQKAVVIFNSALSEKEKFIGYRELIADGVDDVINDIALHIPYFAMERSTKVAMRDFPEEYKNGKRVFDYGDGEIIDLTMRKHIYQGWSSLFKYLLLFMDGKLINSYKVGLDRIPLNLLLENNNNASNFVWQNGEILMFPDTKLVVYRFSTFPNGSIKYNGIQILPDGTFEPYSNNYSQTANSFYGDDEIFHASRIDESALQGKETILIKISRVVKINPQIEFESLCGLINSE